MITANWPRNSAYLNSIREGMKSVPTSKLRNADFFPIPQSNNYSLRFFRKSRKFITRVGVQP